MSTTTASGSFPASPLSDLSSPLLSLALPALVQLLAGVGECPLKVEVSVTPSERVQDLKAQVAALHEALDALQAKYNRTEYLYRCECVINDRLHDYCRSHGLNPPRSLFHKEL